jgi:hypothetical protein
VKKGRRDLITANSIQDRIHLLRGRKVMLDSDLAQLYQVQTFNLNKAVQRNIERFPEDFMFQLTQSEYRSLRFQFGILKKGRHSKYLPYAFTQEGVSMLSGILHSNRAVEVNVAIMRAFVRMQQILSANSELADKLVELENKLIAHDYQIEDILKAIRKLMFEPRKAKFKIGYL